MPTSSDIREATLSDQDQHFDCLILIHGAAGTMQALDFGKWLRKRYVEELAFLPPQYTVGFRSGY